MALVAKYAELLGEEERKKERYKDTSAIQGSLFMCTASIISDIFHSDRMAIVKSSDYTLKPASARTVSVPITRAASYPLSSSASDASLPPAPAPAPVAMDTASQFTSDDSDMLLFTGCTLLD